MNDGAETAEYDNRTESNISVEETPEKELATVNELREIDKLKEKYEGIMLQKVEFRKVNMAVREVKQGFAVFSHFQSL